MFRSTAEADTRLPYFAELLQRHAVEAQVQSLKIVKHAHSSEI